MSHQADGRAGRIPGPPATRDRPPRSSFLADLRAVLGERDFRRLFATRLVSQAGDGVFNAGLGAYVFFSAQSFPDPGAAAVAFAVLYLPYSLVGPFAGVFIDRWSRRQILVWSALIRAVFVVVTASLVASGSLGLPLYVSVLAVLGVNRFFLSSLSAALPHVVAEDKLVMANAVAPTMGTVVGFAGGIAGLGVHLATGGGRGGSAATLLAAGTCYLLAGAVGATMRRDLLGPPPTTGDARRPGLLAELSLVASGLISGARHVWHRRPVATALGATGANRFMYGILLLMSILLYRNYFYATASANTSLKHFTLVVIAAALGYGAAAVVTPLATRRLAKQTWIAILLAAGGVITGLLGPTFSQIPFVIIAFALGIVAQGVAICATTIIQETVDDSYRGRVFALYDLLFNVPFVLGAAGAALIMPRNGLSYPLIAIVAGGYVAAAAAYSLAQRQSAGEPPGSGPSSPAGPPAASPSAADPSPAASSPAARSSAAQRNSS
jgi:MFS family permease